MNGFIKVAAAVPTVQVADCQYNTQQIELLINDAAARGAQLVVFPELSVTGYTCMDLFTHELLLDQAERALAALVRRTRETKLLCIVGLPMRSGNRLFNMAAVFSRGEILGFVAKTYLPNHREYQEKRWFSPACELAGDSLCFDGRDYPAGAGLLFRAAGVTVGVEICEDLWMPVPVSSLLAVQGADVIVNLSASNELAGKHAYLQSLICQQSARCMAGYVYASSGYGESTSDHVFTGKAIIAENGAILAETSERFAMTEKLLVADVHIDYLRHDRRVHTEFAAPHALRGLLQPRFIPFELAPELPDARFTRTIDPHPFVPATTAARDERCDEIVRIQINGLARRLAHTRIEKAVVGVSGGLDSTLALLVVVMTFDALAIPRSQLIGITMPGFGTTGRTYNNAVGLMQSLGIDCREISIADAARRHLADIGHDGHTPDVTYENAQARERTQVLMDVANLENALVVGTGDLSELALGWVTFNGDHMSMYAVNAGIPKTMVRHLVEWVATNRFDDAVRTILLDIAATPISPELTPPDEHGDIRQKTEELVGPYELHDFFIYHLLRYGADPEKIYELAKLAFRGKYEPAVVLHWLKTFVRRFFSQQFKRNCMPEGPKVGSVSLSPRGDWRMPSDAVATEWMMLLDRLDKHL